MDNRTNTIAGWVLAGCIAALGLSIATGMAFKGGELEKKGYPIEGVEAGEGAAAAAEVPIATRLASADVAKGQSTFTSKCGACHTIAQGGAAGVGPNLWATVGAVHGHMAGFAYSDALKGVPGPWTFDALDAWLTSPRKYAPGTKMTFAGLADGQDRANVIAFLNSQGSNLPLPAAPAPGAAGDNATAPADNAAAAAEANATEGASTAQVANQATVNPANPSQDPNAAIQAEKKGH